MEYTNSQIRDLIEEYVHNLRDRQILKARLIDGMTFERLGEMFSMSDRQIKRIVYKLQDQLFKHI